MSETDPREPQPPEPEPELEPAPPSPPAPQLEMPPPAPVHAHRFPQDILTPWGGLALIAFVIAAFVSLILLTNIMALVAVYGFKVKPTNIRSFAETSATFLSIRTGIWYAILIAYLYATISLGRNRPFWQTIGWHGYKRRGVPRLAGYAMFAVAGMALAVIIQLGSLAFPTKKQLPIEALFHNRDGILWLMAVGILVAPAVEETIFRGYIYPVLARRLGIEGGILLTGLLFGLMHAPQLWGGWGQIGLLILVGIILTWARARTGSVVTSWLLHVGYNTFLFAGFFISTGGLRHLPPMS